MTRPLRDVAASVRQRLQNVAKATGRPFQEVFDYYAMERFLYRLARQPCGKRSGVGCDTAGVVNPATTARVFGA